MTRRPQDACNLRKEEIDRRLAHLVELRATLLPGALVAKGELIQDAAILRIEERRRNRPIGELRQERQSVYHMAGIGMRSNATSRQSGGGYWSPKYGWFRIRPRKQDLRCRSLSDLRRKAA